MKKLFHSKWRWNKKRPKPFKILMGSLVFVMVVAVAVTITSLALDHVFHWSAIASQHGPRAKDVRSLAKKSFGVVSGDAANISVTPAAQSATDSKKSTAAAAAAAAAQQAAQAAAASSAATASPNRGIAAGGGLVSLSASALDQYFSELKSFGAAWVRWDVAWSGIQAGGSNSFDWASTDRVAAAAKKYGIQSLAIINHTPGWARQSACSGDEDCPPADPATFGKFAGQAAAHYKAYGVHTWEIWNEPNLGGAWQPAANVGGYAGILKAAYPTIKANDSSATVLAGGLGASADEGGDIAPITFVQGLYNNGAQGSFDAIALHPYSFPVVASYKASWNSWQQMFSVRQTMIQKGDSGKKIWVTEYGAPTGGPGTARSTTDLSFTYESDFMSEQAQSIIATDVIAQYKQNASWLGPFFWYSLKDNGTSSSTPENFFGVERFDGSKKPAYAILQKF